MKNCAILLAAGHSTRMQGTDKLTFELSGKMVVEYSIEALFKHKLIDHVAIVTSKNNFNKIKSIITINQYKKSFDFIEGGDTRFASFLNAFKTITSSEITIIHDAARPFITENLISESINIAKKHGSAVPIIKHVDSAYLYKEPNTLSKQIDRSKLLSSQTPQAYDTKILYDAIQSTKKNKIKFNFNDVPELMLKNGSNPHIFNGSKYNIKLTSTEDILLIKSIHQILNSND